MPPTYLSVTIYAIMATVNVFGSVFSNGWQIRALAAVAVFCWGACAGITIARIEIRKHGRQKSNAGILEEQ